MIGGSGSLISSKTHQPNPPSNIIVGVTTNATATISPTVGYFVINNLMAGFTTSFSYGWSTNYPEPRSSTVSIGPLLRYYFPFRKFAVFPEVAGIGTWQYLRTKGQDSNGIPMTYTTKANRSSYRAGAGIAWFVTPNIGIEGVAAYRQVNFTSDRSWQSQLYLILAIQFYLPTKN